MLIFMSFSRIFRGIISAIGTFFTLSRLFLWDIVHTIINLVTPNKKVGSVIPEGKPGHKGIWPEYIAPKEGDSRCSCPGLNALSNHGILPRDGKNIQFKRMGDVVHEVFNFGSSFSHYVPWYVAQYLQRDYNKDTVDLNDIDVHNCIEHDASICRHDAKIQPDQSKPAFDLIHAFLSSATGDDGKTLTPKDLTKFLEMRRAHSKAHNPQYTLNAGQRFFSSGNASTLLFFFGGNVDDIQIFLNEERFPDRWEPKVRSRKGLTIIQFNQLVSKVEFGIDERRIAKAKKNAPAPPTNAEADVVQESGADTMVPIRDQDGCK